ncbi:MAG: hypothetical protein Q7R72_00290, partial [bacterium]|nr:hypothetical protein [bacterium]
MKIYEKFGESHFWPIFRVVLGFAFLWGGVRIVKFCWSLRDYSADLPLWLPSQFISGNKDTGNNYFIANSVSISGTAINVPFDDVFKRIVEYSSENQVIVVKDGVH